MVALNEITEYPVAGYLPYYSHETKRDGFMKYLNLALSLLLAFGFVFFGAQKFGAENVVFQVLAERSGIDLFNPYIRYFTGASEIVIAILLLIPRTRLVASLAGIGLLFGAIGLHLSPWLGIDVPNIGKGLFYTAVVMFVLTLVNGLVSYRAGRKIFFWKGEEEAA